MQLSLTFPFAPLSQNNIERTGARNNIRYKTPEAKEYRQRIDETCLKNKAKINEFKKNVDKNKHIIEVSYDWCLNHKNLLVKGKDRRLKLNAPDTFNFEKFTTDCIFANLGLNDVLIWNGHVKRIPVADESYFVMHLIYENIRENRFYKEFI